MAHARRDGADLVLSVQVQPRASRDEIAGIHGDAVRIRVAAPPVDGEANEALCRFLAKACGVARSAVEVESGSTGRRKRVRIRNPRTIPPSLGIDAGDPPRKGD